MSDESGQELDALCPECGQAFKVYVDRLVADGRPSGSEEKHECPTCGCRECRITDSVR